MKYLEYNVLFIYALLPLSLTRWNVLLSLSCGEGKKDMGGLVCWCLRLGLAKTLRHRPDSLIVVQFLNVSEHPSVYCKTCYWIFRENEGKEIHNIIQDINHCFSLFA